MTSLSQFVNSRKIKYNEGEDGLDMSELTFYMCMYVPLSCASSMLL
jgi:hypothetical protein